MDSEGLHIIQCLNTCHCNDNKHNTQLVTRHMSTKTYLIWRSWISGACVILFNTSDYISQSTCFSKNKKLAIFITTKISFTCNDFRWFWISWTQNVISFGLGNVTLTNTFVYFQDPDFTPIRHMSVASSGYYQWIVPCWYYPPGK